MINMKMKSNNKVGSAITETASYAYDGTLLPADGSNIRYLKDKGKLKTNLAVQSGQGKYFNGSNQYFNTGVIPNASEGTLTVRFTYNASTNRCVVGRGGVNANLSISVNGSGYIEVGFGSFGMTTGTLLSNVVAVSGTSYIVTVVYSGLLVKLYVNGVYVNSASSTAKLGGSTTLAVGARNNDNVNFVYYWNSIIQHVSYYDVALADAQILQLFQYPERIKEYNGAIVPDIGNEANCKLFLPMSESSGYNVYDVSKTPATAIAVQNPTTTLYTSAKQLPYGAQCIAWKRDALGVPLGVSNGISNDSGLSIGTIATSYYVNPNESIVIELVRYITLSDSTVKLSGVNTGERFSIGQINSSTTPVAIRVGSISVNYAATAGYHHIVAEYIYATKKLNVYIDGVKVGNNLDASTVDTASIATLSINSENASTPAYYATGIIPMYKIHKGDQYTKFNIDKAWANAQKVIAKLP